MNIELIYFDGCPNAAAARSNIDAALARAGMTASVQVWEQNDPGSPTYARAHGSPTVLVNGRDVTGGVKVTGMACRADGAPDVDTILQALRRAP